MGAYRTKICKPDTKGYYRPEVAGKRFNVGHKSDISEGEAQRRRNALQTFFEQQRADHGQDLWANWALPFAVQIAAGDKPILEVSDFARANAGQASEEALMLERLKRIGVDVSASDPSTTMVGELELRRIIAAEVRREVDKALADLTKRTGMSEDLAQRIAGTLPHPTHSELRTFHDARRISSSFGKDRQTSGQR